MLEFLGRGHTEGDIVARLWDEFNGIERPVIWTAERDRAVWDQLQG